MNKITQLALSTVLGLSTIYSGCRGCNEPREQRTIIYLDTVLRAEDSPDAYQLGDSTHNDDHGCGTNNKDNNSNLETTLEAATSLEIPGLSSITEITTPDSYIAPLETSIETTDTNKTTDTPEATTNDLPKNNYTDASTVDASAVNLSREVTPTLSTLVTPTPCPQQKNTWYTQIKSVLEDKILSSLQQQEKLGDILNKYISNHGGEIFVNVTSFQSTKNIEFVCQGALSTVFYEMVNGESNSANSNSANDSIKNGFVNTLAPYLCQKEQLDQLTYDPANPIVRFKTTN